MASVPTGTTFFFATAFGPSKTTTVVTNAAEAVVTSAGHGYAAGEIVEVTSGWGRLNLRYARVKSPTTDTFLLEGMDTSNTTFFPAGQGTGSVRKVTSLQQITGVLSVNSSGGDPKTVTYQYMESDVELSINNGFSAVVTTLEIDADQIGSAGYNALKSLTDVQSYTVLQMVAKNGSKVYQPCTVALNEVPKLQDGQINRVTCTVNGTNRPTRYAS